MTRLKRHRATASAMGLSSQSPARRRTAEADPA
jgi:hypothetical protein